MGSAEDVVEEGRVSLRRLKENELVITKIKPSDRPRQPFP